MSTLDECFIECNPFSVEIFIPVDAVLEFAGQAAIEQASL